LGALFFLYFGLTFKIPMKAASPDNILIIRGISGEELISASQNYH
jgi:hypothetical protein